jgi:dynein heavy chain
MIESTQIVYNKVAEKLRPTPSKMHYTFNLRDISKVFQGMCSGDAKSTQDTIDLIRLWIHEVDRVFGDRMINKNDKGVLNDLCVAEAGKMKVKEKDIMNVERLLFGDYFAGIDGENRPYVQITDLDKLLENVTEFLEDYNSLTKHPMKLVMFLDACDHVNRICRVLRQPLGNALLLGVGGSGRQSLTKLSTFMSSYKMYQIEVVKGYSMRDWRDNLKFVLMQAGVEAKPTTFLFVDTQIISEQQLEDINNVLNSGDVP